MNKIKHGVVFTNNKQKIVLLLDRIILSVDEKLDNEFIFANIEYKSVGYKNIDKTLYFCASFDNYTRFKKKYKKTNISGFWHSLFINNKINLAENKEINISTDDVVYSLQYDQNSIETNFTLIGDNDQIVSTTIDDDLVEFIQIISPAEKIKKARLIRNITIIAIVSTWVIGFVAYKQGGKIQDDIIKQEEQKILKLKNNIDLLDKQLTRARENIITKVPIVIKNLQHLLTLQFNNINVFGKTNLTDIKLNSNTDIATLQSFTQKYPYFKIKEQIEKPTKIGVDNEY